MANRFIPQIYDKVCEGAKKAGWGGKNQMGAYIIQRGIIFEEMEDKHK